MKVSTATHNTSAAPEAPAAEIQSRVVHTTNGGAVRSRFVLHSSHQRLADTIDRMNGAPAAFRPGAASGTPTISREQVLPVMVGHPEGISVVDICIAILGRNDDRAVHRISALVAREVGRGTIMEAKGRGAKRQLTLKGRQVAAQIEMNRSREKELATQHARSAERVGEMGGRRVNGVFDWALKVQLGVL